MKTVTEKRFGEFHEDDISVTLRASSASYGGGSEVLVICRIPEPVERYAHEIAKESAHNMSQKINL